MDSLRMRLSLSTRRFAVKPSGANPVEEDSKAAPDGDCVPDAAIWLAF
jgi:hypothetical protein